MEEILLKILRIKDNNGIDNIEMEEYFDENELLKSHRFYKLLKRCKVREKDIKEISYPKLEIRDIEKTDFIRYVEKILKIGEIDGAFEK